MLREGNVRCSEASEARALASNAILITNVTYVAACGARGRKLRRYAFGSNLAVLEDSPARISGESLSVLAIARLK